MKCPKSTLEYNQILDAMAIVNYRRGATWRSVARFVCEKYTHLVFELGWDEDIVEEMPNIQMLGKEACDWAEEILGYDFGSITNGNYSDNDIVEEE